MPEFDVELKPGPQGAAWVGIHPDAAAGGAAIVELKLDPQGAALAKLRLEPTG